MSAACGLGLNGPPVLDHAFALAFPEVYDLPVWLESVFSRLVPAGADFIMGVEVQAAAELNLSREIQRLHNYALAAEAGGLHVGKAQKSDS